jgi:hypothetical protein
VNPKLVAAEADPKAAAERNAEAPAQAASADGKAGEAKKHAPAHEPK